MAEVEKEKTLDAFREGLFVRALGRSCANPYSQSSGEYVLWEKGWRFIDEKGEGVPTTNSISRIKLVPEFMPGAAAVQARPESKKFIIALFIPVGRVAEMLRVVAVVALVILMTLALRW